jgi:hypothetical protein
VCQFFEDDSYEYVRRFVSAEEAVKAADHYCHSVAAKTGIVRRVSLLMVEIMSILNGDMDKE